MSNWWEALDEHERQRQQAGPSPHPLLGFFLSGAKGMKVTVESVNAKGEKNTWWYTTDFDGKDMPVTGQENAVTSVRTIDDRINEIINKRNGVVTQVLTNVLSPDGNTVGVMCMRMDPTGKKTTNVTFATYERIP
jgi:hypothetical protein